MSDTSFIVPSSDPFFSKLVPANNKLEIVVRSSETEYTSSEMSGGSYASHSKMRLDNREPLPFVMGGSFPSFERGINKILPGEVFIETGMFCGKAARPKVSLNPLDYERLRPRKKCIFEHPDCLSDANLSELCANATPFLAEKQEAILRAYSLVGKYKAEALRNIKATDEDISKLIEIGFIEKKGSGFGKTLKARNYKFSNGG